MTAAQSPTGQRVNVDENSRDLGLEEVDESCRLDSDNGFQVQVSNISAVSAVSEASDFLRDSTTSENISRQCTDIDRMVSSAVHEVLVKKALRAAVRDCKFCVTIANPRGSDFPLIAVSEEFETMTGYKRNEILGVNCRFLNQGCDMDPPLIMDLRIASETGASFTGLLPNRKKSGELFLNLLDLRGMTVARHCRTGEDLWFLIGIQADVTELADEEVPEDHLPELQVLSDGIRASIRKELSEMAVKGSTVSGDLPALEASLQQRSWRLLEEPEWRPGPPLGHRRNMKAPDLANSPTTPRVTTSESPQGPRTEPKLPASLGAAAASSSSAAPVVVPIAAPPAAAEVVPKATPGFLPVLPEVATCAPSTPTPVDFAEGEAQEPPNTSIVDTRSSTSGCKVMLLPLFFGAFAFAGALLLLARRRSRK